MTLLDGFLCCMLNDLTRQLFQESIRTSKLTSQTIACENYRLAFIFVYFCSKHCIIIHRYAIYVLTMQTLALARQVAKVPWHPFRNYFSYLKYRVIESWLQEEGFCSYKHSLKRA